MTNGFRGLLVGGGEPIYVKLKEVEKLAVRHFKISKNNAFNSIQFGGFRQICDQKNPQNEESKALSAITKMQIS